jgi:hypothetical protein
MSIVEKLTEGIVNRDLSKDGSALISKWEKTGLLEGLEHDHLRNGMASLLENQARELLRETSTMKGGDVEGFAAVAFPLVRRVFGNLIANDLVSVQPMSLPSGLIFFLDFTISSEIGAGATSLGRLGYDSGKSLFGGGVVGEQLTGGVNLDGVGTNAANAGAGPYGLNNGYASATGSAALNTITLTPANVVNGTFGAGGELDRLVDFDPDFVSGSTTIAVVSILRNALEADAQQLLLDDLVAIQISSGEGNGICVEAAGAYGFRLVRRHTHISSSTRFNMVFINTGSNGANATGATTSAQLSAGALTGLALAGNTMSWAQKDNFNNVGTRALGALVGATPWALENEANIPEIDIKVDSVAVTAVTKKLKAKWSPELGQDLNAYHNLDAEVELTQILSEQIALEIDREILEDLVVGAKAGTRYWSRAPGRFLDRVTGVEVGASTVTPDFTGNVSEWYETLIETINDVSAQIHRKTLRGGANFVVCGPEVANILEFTAGFRANVAVDSDRGTAGAVKVGSLSKKWDIYVDPYFLRSVLLVGRKGSSFLESGYVYAPYVPLQTTPTIFGVEDFVPRKGVMTRYAKKMVRPDMYGIVVVADMTIG